MHPLLLHLPIVVILLAMGMEFFRFNSRTLDKDAYELLTELLLFAGIVLSGITVIMGIFLAKEGGYNSEKLQWHKWAGTALFFLGVAVHVCRQYLWYRALSAKTAAVLVAMALIVTGHSGGSLTHGDDFVWKPVMSEPDEPVAVAVDEAAIFDHVIRPVFNAKCVSCHNADKRKGKLLLTDSLSIRKGGKTGSLFVSGDPENSLLLQRLHLPIDDKKHMPPTNKPQLTKDEAALLYHWVKGGASFSKRITQLPIEDTLRIVAARVLEEKQKHEEVFDFPAVAQRTLDKLNSNYRVIRPLARNSPALTVNLYNRGEYSPRTLSELQDVRTQVISLDVARMPLSDEDLKSVARFENLKSLNLNFTDVTGAGLRFLRDLEHLATLSLAGTRVTYDDLRKHLPALRKLKSIAIWDTALQPTEIEALQKEFRHLTITGASSDNGTLIKLNPPRLKNKVRVFTDSISLELFHPVNGVDIRYSTNGADPDSAQSLQFVKGAVIRETTSIKARAFKSGWGSSDVATLQLLRRAHQPDTAILLSKLNRVHVANGARTFFDYELGSFNANSPAWANNWGGFIGNDMDLVLHYKSPIEVRSVSLNMLIETENSIFPLSELEVWGGSSADEMKLLTRKRTTLPQEYRKPYIELMHFDIPPHRVSYLRIVAKPVMKLAAWHKRKDKPALLLIDEILIN
jgi:uncharacterized membrane protein